MCSVIWPHTIDWNITAMHIWVRTMMHTDDIFIFLLLLLPKFCHLISTPVQFYILVWIKMAETRTVVKNFQIATKYLECIIFYVHIQFPLIKFYISKHLCFRCSNFVVGVVCSLIILLCHFVPIIFDSAFAGNFNLWLYRTAHRLI